MTTAVSTATAVATTTSAATTTATQKSDYETFLIMLTAQAKYQDPLEPMDSSEYASQLAQFSMVEKQTENNDILSSIAQQIGLANMAAMSGWVGMEARAAAPGYFDGSTPITIAPNPAAASDTVQLVVSDSDGTEVQRVTLPVSADAYEWDGVDDDGSAFASGSYTFVVESIANGEVLMSEMAEVYSNVAETQMQGTNVVLILEGGSAILASSVTALRSSDS
ncbi:flagellar hook capping FlgD N-terminal domain-containing protein [Parasedimentitalea psychrophila]|uniref:Basal-body rod modification protein FlgD n=1 Tax=Parasedimentitalea psychrophila TaxID=2997337 RepID=A0A9Y2L239_9RHOB|nr:flagellar hook capping FlgD N-terminal domain-containing protein [Parasedimentitalea psychrophila]WIY26738.1 flagellar hook capping FlgD N-terminal domain-containing protein [Parasedimentitalea psychrophila]